MSLCKVTKELSNAALSQCKLTKLYESLRGRNVGLHSHNVSLLRRNVDLQNGPDAARRVSTGSGSDRISWILRGRAVPLDPVATAPGTDTIH